MKTIRYILFIPIIYTIISYLFISIPFLLELIFSLEDSTLITVMFLFGGGLIGLYYVLPGGIIFLASKISPNLKFSFYSTLLITLGLGFLFIFKYWSTIDSYEVMGFYLQLVVTSLTFGFISSIILGLSLSPIFEEILDDRFELPITILMLVGGKIFSLGIFLIICFISIQLCEIRIDKEYSWYSGIWHGIFVIPKWIFSFFVESPIYFKAPESSLAYKIFWWISLIIFPLGIFGSRNNY